jgi:hypothetical protein
MLLFLKYPGRPYALVYWYGEVFIIFLALAAILETAKHLFPRYSFLDTALKVVWALGAGAALVAILMLILTRVQSSVDRVFELIILGERSIRFLQACWLILVIAYISYWRRDWRQYSVGIVAGFGVYSSLTLAILELRAHLHLISDVTLVLLNSAAYNVAAIIWAVFFFSTWHSSPSERLPKADLSSWNDAVTEYHSRRWFRP